MQQQGSSKQTDQPPSAPTGLEPGSELDLCFICDCTGSMGAYIHAAQTNITSIVSKISQQHGAGVRFGLIAYRDHPPQDSTYVTKCFEFTDNTGKMNEYVNSMSAQGGGDGPEAVTAGLYAALHLPWRPNATKVCVLIADAPPHGLEPYGDGFPNGDPDGRDPLEIAREMVVHGITVYTVGCEPALGGYQFARDFFCTIAEITSGQAVALSSAALLADVIINGSAEELSLSKLQSQVEEEVSKIQANARVAGKSISTEEAVSAACVNLQSAGIQAMQMQTDGHMMNATKEHWGSVSTQKNLAAVKASLGAAFPSGAQQMQQQAIPMAMPYMSLMGGMPPEVCSAGAPPGPMMGGPPAMMGASMPSPAPQMLASGGPPALAACASPPLMMPQAMPMPQQQQQQQQQQAASAAGVERGLISHSQVARMVQKAQYQQRLL